MGHWFRPVSQSPVCRRRQSEDFSKTPHLAGSSCCRTKTWCNFVQELQLFDCERDLPALVIANVSRQKGQRLIPATPFYTCCLKLWPCSRRNPELRCLAGDQRKSTVTVFQTGLGLNPPPLLPSVALPVFRAVWSVKVTAALNCALNVSSREKIPTRCLDSIFILCAEKHE